MNLFEHNPYVHIISSHYQVDIGATDTWGTIMVLLGATLSKLRSCLRPTGGSKIATRKIVSRIGRSYQSENNTINIV